MVTNHNAAPAPESEGGNSQPNLNVVPAPKPKRRSPFALNITEEREISRTLQICKVAQAAAYAGKLENNKIPQSIVTALEAEARAAHKKSEDALNSTSAQAGDVADGADAKATLMGSLRTIQSAARTEFTLTDPERVKNYLVGQDIAANQTVLEASAQTILDQANADRPGSVNTDFISRVTGECSAVVDAKASKQSHRGSGKQQRADRKAMVKSIVARRKQIQYAADTSWPHTQPGTKKARVEFQLPAKRPFSY